MPHSNTLRKGLLASNQIPPLAHALPEPRQPPDAPDTTTLLDLPDVLLTLAHLARPLGGDPAAQAVLDALLLDGAAAGDDGGRDQHRGHAGDALDGQDGAVDEGLGRGAGGEAARQADGDEGAGQAARNDGRVGEEDGARDEVGD